MSKVFPLPDYLTMLIRTFMTSISREHISTPCWRNTIVIETANEKEAAQQPGTRLPSSVSLSGRIRRNSGWEAAA